MLNVYGFDTLLLRHYSSIILISLLIELKPEHKIRNFRTFIKNVQVLNSYRYSKWLCGSWSTRRVCDRSVQGFLLKSLWKQNESSSLFLRNKNEKKSYVKVRKKTVEWESGKEWRMTIYKEMRKERFGRCSVGDLIYRNKRKEIKTITFLLFTKSLPWVFSEDVTLKWRQSAHSP